MTTETTDTPRSGPANMPLALNLSDGLGPVAEALRLATVMMRDSWATGSDAAWQPAYQALESHLHAMLAAGGSPVDRGVRPVAYRLRDDDARSWLYYSDDELHAAAKAALEPLYGRAELDAAVAAERERIKAAVTRCTLLAENCEDDGPEVDTARKSMACTILAAIAGHEASAPAGTQQGLFGA